jgi:hypothetical protein
VRWSEQAGRLCGLEDVLLEDGSIEDEEADLLDMQDDPLSQLDLATFLSGFLRNFAASNRPAFDHCSGHLTPVQQAAIRPLLS